MANNTKNGSVKTLTEKFELTSSKENKDDDNGKDSCQKSFDSPQTSPSKKKAGQKTL